MPPLISFQTPSSLLSVLGHYYKKTFDGPIKYDDAKSVTARAKQKEKLQGLDWCLIDAAPNANSAIVFLTKLQAYHISTYLHACTRHTDTHTCTSAHTPPPTHTYIYIQRHVLSISACLSMFIVTYPFIYTYMCMYAYVLRLECRTKTFRNILWSFRDTNFLNFLQGKRKDCRGFYFMNVYI